MITAGVDSGARNLKVVVLDDGRVVGRSLLLAGVDATAAAEQAFDEALKQAGISRDRVDRVIATGIGRKIVPVAHDIVTDEEAAARGAKELYAEARTVIDVGAEDGRAIKVAGAGDVVDFAINEKCAAGAGAFCESMARALEVPLEELGTLSLESNSKVPMNAQCVVFAESEVVSLVHRETSRADIARAVLFAIAERTSSMVGQVGVERQIILVGGVARNVGFVRELERNLEAEVVVPEYPEYVGALGAALAATGS